MTTQSNFNVENIVGRYTTSRQVFQEYAHICRNEYKVTRALCKNCLFRLEETRGISHKPIPKECVCDDIPPHITEKCIQCEEIKEEISFLKNEIRRTSVVYGIEVAETLEMNPLFLETIEKLVFRVEILEQVLLRQWIDMETATRLNQDNTPDDVSELSEEYILEEDDDLDEIETCDIEQEEGEEPDEIDDMEKDLSPNRANVMNMANGFIQKPDLNIPINIQEYTERPMKFKSDTNYCFNGMSVNYLHVTLPQPQFEPETNDDEIDSITRHISRMDIVDEEIDDTDNKKRKRPDSPELWLYDGNMV
jgi:hypothetical protein